MKDHPSNLVFTPNDSRSPISLQHSVTPRGSPPRQSSSGKGQPWSPTSSQSVTLDTETLRLEPMSPLPGSASRNRCTEVVREIAAAGQEKVLSIRARIADERAKKDSLAREIKDLTKAIQTLKEQYSVLAEQKGKIVRERPVIQDAVRTVAAQISQTETEYGLKAKEARKPQENIEREMTEAGQRIQNIVAMTEGDKAKAATRTNELRRRQDELEGAILREERAVRDIMKEKEMRTKQEEERQKSVNELVTRMNGVLLH